jgi:hypothetical protein
MPGAKKRPVRESDRGVSFSGPPLWTQETGFCAVSQSMKKRLLPLGIKNPIKTELPALVGLEAIGKPWFRESHRSDLLAIALVSQILAPEGSYIYVVAGELISALHAADLNIDEIRPLVLDISAWLQVQPNGRVDAAIEKLIKQSVAAATVPA